MPTTRGDLLSSELRFIDEFKKTIATEVASSHDDAGVLGELSKRLAQYERRLQEIMSTGSLAVPNYGAWDSVTVIKTASGRLLLKKEVPGPQASSEVEIPSHVETHEVKAHVTHFNKVCNMMKQSEALLREALERQADMETDIKALSQPPEELVGNHIRLLRQYNEVKDVGQQLIGMIADNRGVSIASLYEVEEFGLTADD